MQKLSSLDTCHSFCIPVSKHDHDFVIMFTHYIKFLSKVTQGMFMFPAVISSHWLWNKCTGCTHDCETTSRKALSSYLHMQLVVIVWVCTRFQYHYALCLLIDTILESIHQLIYFYTLIWEGKIGIYTGHESKHTSFSAKEGVSQLHHWRVTLTVLNAGAMILLIAYQSYTASSMAPPIYSALAFTVILYAWIKDYIENYVAMSKI